MTLNELKQKANTVLIPFWNELQIKQDAYFAKHGKYFQLLITNPVVDGVDTDFEKRVPSDEKNIADVDFDYTGKVPFQIEVNEWKRGEDAGYSAKVTVNLTNGDAYCRERNNLNEDTGWYKKPNITN